MKTSKLSSIYLIYLVVVFMAFSSIYSSSISNSIENSGKQAFIKSKEKSEEKCIDAFHTPYGEEESFDMKNYSIMGLMTFTGSVIAAILILETIKSKSNSFFQQSFIYLSEETSYLMYCICLVAFLYLIRALDGIKLNWQSVISGFFFFCFSWLFISSLVILFSFLVTYKWEELEINSKSFKHVKTRYEKNCKSRTTGIINQENSNVNQNVNSNTNTNPSYYFELFEYLILKTYFIVPFYPLFKPSVLKSSFSMSRYLKFCLLEKIQMLFKLSWTAFVLSIVTITTFNVFVINLSFNDQIIFMMCFPLIGLLTLIILYVYFKIVYRRTVIQVTDDNYSEFKDLEEVNQNYATEKFLNYPLYLEEIINDINAAKVAKINYHSHIHGRTSNFYEDTIAFGASGFYIFFNVFQAFLVVFIIWFTYAIVTLVPELFIQKYSSFIKILVITGIVFFILAYSILIASSLRWYTVISSIEMKRNEECLEKCIKEELNESSELSESIFKSFKRLYFDIKVKNRERIIDNAHSKTTSQEEIHSNNSNKQVLKKMLISTILRFKSIQNIEDINMGKNNDNIARTLSQENDLLITPKYSYSRDSYKELSIDVCNELKLFLKTSGNDLTNQDINFMLHMIENFDKYNRSKVLTQSQLYEIWNVMIHFANLKPEDVFIFVFNEYYNERLELFNSNKFTEEGLLEFFRWYQEYFSKQQIEFIEKQLISIIGKRKEVSIDYFIGSLLSLRKFERN